MPRYRPATVLTAEVIDSGTRGRYPEGAANRAREVTLRGQQLAMGTTNDSAAGIAIGQVVGGYFAMWNDVDPERRRAIIGATWEDNGNYVDPLFTAAGYGALGAMVVAAHERFPGYRFTLTEALDTHHDRARWGWALGGPDGEPPVAVGVDFATLGADGRLREVTGFFAQPGGNS